jgi:SAM-dependent methyltransferase
MSASMSATPLLFDRQRLASGARRTDPSQNFLMPRAAQELEERLAATLRPFPLALDLGTPTDAFSEALRRARPDARIIRASISTAADVILDEEMMPFEDSTFDLVVSGLSLQSVNDLPGTLAQARRLLKPDGLFMASLIGGRTLHELRSALTEAEAELTGGASPRVHPFVDVRDMGALLQRAGLALPVTDIDSLTVRYPHLFALMADLRALGATNALADRMKRPTRRAVFVRAAEIYAARFADADGRIRATVEIVWASGWAPHESQQKPLRPGSARSRLADVLKVAEQSAGETAGH